MPIGDNAPQACRLPYELVVDGENKDLGDVRYLLSPQDLAGYHRPRCFEQGSHLSRSRGDSSPQVCRNITPRYRRAIDAVVAKQTLSESK